MGITRDLCDECSGRGENVVRTHAATFEEPASEETSTCDACAGTGTVPAEDDDLDRDPPLFIGSTSHHPLIRFDLAEDEAA